MSARQFFKKLTVLLAQSDLGLLRSGAVQRRLDLLCRLRVGVVAVHDGEPERKRICKLTAIAYKFHGPINPEYTRERLRFSSNNLRARLLHDLGPRVADHLREAVVAVDDRVVDNLSIGKNKTAV